MTLKYLSFDLLFFCENYKEANLFKVNTRYTLKYVNYRIRTISGLHFCVPGRKLITDGRTLKENNKKLENQIYELKQTISNQNSNQERLEKNITNLSKNNKHIDVTNKNKDITINKLSEDKKLLSAEISKLNKMNKEMQTKQDKQNAQYELTLKKLERQKNELFIGKENFFLL